MLHGGRLDDGERVRRVCADGDGQVLPGQLDARLLSQPADLVVVAVGPRSIDVRLGGAATLEQALGEIGLIAAALRRLAQHLQLALLPHQLVEALLDRVHGGQALLLDIRFRGGQVQVRGGEVVPPLAAVEEELARAQRRAVPAEHLGTGHLHYLCAGCGIGERADHLAAAVAGVAQGAVEVELGQDGRARDDLVLLRGKRLVLRAPQVVVAVEGKLDGLL